MKNTTFGGFNNIDAFIADKQKRLSESSRDLRALFDFMFSERDNVMFERSAGYRIIKTTYGEVRGRALRRAFVLKAVLSGVPEGAVVGLYLENSEAWIELFWAILACGFCPLLLNTRLGPDMLCRALASVHAEAVIGEGASFPLRTVALSEIEPGEEEYLSPHFGESVFVMSSGTSEHVKVCEYTGAEFCATLSDSMDIISSCPSIKKHYHGQLKLLAFLPFCHIFGLVAMYLWFGFFSRTFVLLGDYSPNTIMDTIRRHEVTHIFAVPLFWNKVYAEAMKAIDARGEATRAKFEKGMRLSRKLAKMPAVARVFRKRAFRELRGGLFGESASYFISGGSEIGRDVLEFFNCIGYRLENGFGMTEVGITSVELSDDHEKLCGGSVGLPFSSLKYRLGDNNELMISGPSTAKRIFEGDTITCRSEWFRTGDIAEFRGGSWYVLGRLDDLVISPTGENLNPCLIEDKLSVPGAREVCLTSVRENGLITPALIVSVNPLLDREGIKNVYESIRAKLAENGLDGQIAKAILVREPLLGGDDFKLNRATVSRRLSEGGFTVLDPSDEASSDETDDLTASICALFAMALNKPAAEIGPRTDFFLDAGGSSLDFFGVVSRIQEEYGILFPADSGRTLCRPADISEYVRRAVNGI